MPLQRSTAGVCHALLQFPKQTVPTCSAKVSRTNVHSCTMWFRQITKYAVNPHSTKQDTQPIAFLISSQLYLYPTKYRCSWLPYELRGSHHFVLRAFLIGLFGRLEYPIYKTLEWVIVPGLMLSLGVEYTDAIHEAFKLTRLGLVLLFTLWPLHIVDRMIHLPLVVVAIVRARLVHVA
jgi:hypothetical protein